MYLSDILIEQKSSNGTLVKTENINSFWPSYHLRNFMLSSMSGRLESCRHQQFYSNTSLKHKKIKITNRFFVGFGCLKKYYKKAFQLMICYNHLLSWLILSYFLFAVLCILNYLAYSLCSSVPIESARRNCIHTV